MDQKLPPHLQRKLEQNVVNSAMQQNVALLMTLSSTCFNECVQTFPSKLLNKSELTCVEHCADRYISLSQGVGERYQRIQAQKVMKEKIRKSKEEGNRN